MNPAALPTPTPINYLNLEQDGMNQVQTNNVNEQTFMACACVS